MRESTGKVVLNKSYEGDETVAEKPVHLREIRNNSQENIGHAGLADEPWNPVYETIEEKSYPTKQSNGRYLALVIIVCLISLAAFLLTLLMLFGKMGEKCECSTNKALSTSLEKLAIDEGKIRTLEENITSLQRDLVEKSIDINKTRLSLDDLTEKYSNLRAKFNMTKLHKDDCDLASSLMETRLNITAQTAAWLSTIRDDANDTMNQLMASDADTKVALEAVNTTHSLRLESLDAAFTQLTTYLNRTNIDLEELNSTILKTDAGLSALRDDFDQSKIQFMASDSETRKTLRVVNSSVTQELEKLDSSLNQLKSALNRTNTDLAELNDTLRKLPCCSDPCKNGGSCYPGNERCKFICVCAPGFVGKECEKAAESCKELNDDHKDKDIPGSNQAYPLKLGLVTLPVYCHMTSLGACGDGGWTLVIKMDGSKNTFHFDSKFWGNMTEFNTSAGRTGLDEQETMLPTYWNANVTKICLGMKNGEQINFILINKTAESLYSLIADGEYRNTSLGRNTWKSLLGSDASLQPYCNKEGFNAHTRFPDHPKARIGILGNEQNHCDSCDSRIGFGMGGGSDGSNTCGNLAEWGGDNGNKYIKAMGYIFVQ